MAKTYSAGGVAHGAKYWRLTIDVRESDGERRRLTKTTKIACAKSGTRGRSAALTALRQWRDEPIRQAEAEDSVGLGTPTADYAEDFIARHSEMAPPPGRSTCAPRATCALRATLAAALASAREAQRERIRGFGRWSPSPFICENPLTGAWLSPNVLSSRWSALSAAMNWLGTQSDPVIFHDLRHTFATVSIAQGCDVMSLASILDHKDPSMTMKVYATALAAPKRAAMDRLLRLDSRFVPRAHPFACASLVPPTQRRPVREYPARAFDNEHHCAVIRTERRKDPPWAIGSSSTSPSRWTNLRDRLSPPGSHSTISSRGCLINYGQVHPSSQ